MKLTIPKKFILLIIVIGVLVFSSDYFLLDSSKNKFIESESQKINANLVLARQSIEDRLREYQSITQIISKELSLKKLVNSNVNTKEWESEKGHSIEHFQDFCTSIKDCLKIRYINSKGDEVIRIEKKYGSFESKEVAKLNLQNIKNRTYFKSVIETQREMLYVSRLDLNIEHDKVEEPYVPTLRVGKPLYNSENKLQGVLMINFYGQKIIDIIKSIDEDYTLLSEDLRYIIHPQNPAYQWGRQLDTIYRAVIHRNKDGRYIHLGHDFTKGGGNRARTVYDKIHIRAFWRENLA